MLCPSWLSQREDKFNEQYIESIIKSDTVSGRRWCVCVCVCACVRVCRGTHGPIFRVCDAHSFSL